MSISTPWRRRGTALVGAVIALLLVSGCATIPRGGGVNAGHAVDRPEGPEVVFLARGPEKDASREEILTGFIEAAASPAGNYATAREFLTATLAGSWKPDARAIVDQAEQRKITPDDGSGGLSLTTNPEAAVDSTGQYTPSFGNSSIQLDFTFSRVDGQWRISGAPDGVILDPVKFREVFKPYTLRFFDPTWIVLVPEVRWFPSRSSTSTNVVKALLAGPSPWLAGAVSSAFPEGTRLLSDAVPVDNSVANINLNREAGGQDDLTLRRMKAQLTESLSEVSSIKAISLSINGVAQEAVPLTISGARTDPRALVLTKDGFGFQTDDRLEKIAVLSAHVEALNPSAVAIDGTRQLIAALAPSGVSAIRPGGPELVDARPHLIAPSIDEAGNIWTVPNDAPGEILVITPDGKQHPVAASWPDASQIVSLQVSRDGTRVLAFVVSGGRSTLLVAGIQKDENGVPSKLGEPIRVPAAAGSAASATWVDENSVASLGTNDQGVAQIVQSTIGGRSESLVTVSGGREIVGGSSENQLRVLVEGGRMMQWRSGSWQQVASDVRVIATQQGAVERVE
ncbi:hypothetical protein M2390_001918 [Mycetocola sp. BIGb0189]|uniref:LpqB family beta-propeller domain-containing protein n=1 Tax=Mycetocola sp. BIGb0189 TaxID=2940604 RepID=UPI002167B85B|nr:LpqB family beta-propeller domain-containing protein [Mycetocola sp. BIGb0189]MCS4276724.1 hypothetical protein [Mycetocola sp. BIGb0189]